MLRPVCVIHGLILSLLFGLDAPVWELEFVGEGFSVEVVSRLS